MKRYQLMLFLCLSLWNHFPVHFLISFFLIAAESSSTLSNCFLFRLEFNFAPSHDYVNRTAKALKLENKKTLCITRPSTHSTPSLWLGFYRTLSLYSILKKRNKSITPITNLQSIRKYSITNPSGPSAENAVLGSSTPLHCLMIRNHPHLSPRTLLIIFMLLATLRLQL